MNSSASSLSIDRWISFFKSGIVSPDMPAAVARAFFYHLADLGLFEREADGLWRLIGAATVETPDDLFQRLGALASIKKALFIPYFMHPPKDLPDILSLKFSAKSSTQETEASIGKKVSDLSNLQIVKKIGRQLEPFIELEKKFFDHVEGLNTSKEDARILFSHLLEITREKGRPREWEQLSRRRHK